ncbi:MAG: KH domain-containing protein [Erysipelotrichaceae bacterium]|jgi:spoIIIJ-associated protein|nr:KH domain-containing protein [Erysipelotrichaceae bacterium]MBQ1757357.1 KH domain-containing protein [Erysipelotrichaceae bacterium]MBQ3384689.1 KH domain-containing protein [Erysipelotrichaceae bacterium]MBR2600272.1 KH domain-containing protein [Erysipelotrichaceae bacterium]MBR2792420.1 KH domain-containing protein [Erysipelotrichaceae bacterium]
MKKYEAKNLDEALKAAAADKRVKIEDLKYYVLEEKPGGLFGIGSKAIIEAYTFNDVRDFIESYLKQYFDNIGMNVELIVNKLDDNSFNVIVNANNNAILIGKNGQTLEAMKTVLNAAANAQFKCHVHMSVDVNGYKEERYEKLKSTVERIAKTVVKTHVSARLGDLTNDERKIVHQHLSNMAHIRTESEGDGNNRRLKIIYDRDKA